MAVSNFKLSTIAYALSSTLLLSACGGGGSSSSTNDTDTTPTTPVPSNTAPQADAGSAQTIDIGETVSLSGQGSSDADGDALSYQWSITSAPDGSSASISNDTTESPTIIPDIAGTYQLSLIVNDGQVDSSSSTVSITVLEATVNENTPPEISINYSPSVTLDSSTIVDASATTDIDNNELVFAWELTSRPQTSQLSLDDETEAQITINFDMTGDYIIELTVNDGTDSSVDTVTISVTDSQTPTPDNQTPNANAGTDQTVNVEELVQLSGSGSNDADNDTLTYLWSITSLPDGSLTALTEVQKTSEELQISPDTSGEYTLSLVVNDGQISSTASTVTINAQANNLDITDKIFIERSASCADYIGTYQSNVEDIKRGISFSGSVSISATSNECTIDVNQIPNHDFNDQSASFATNVSEVSENYRLPVTAQFSGSEVYLELGTTEAIMLNGVTLDILPAACYDVGNEPLGLEKIGCGGDQNDHPWRYDPMSPLNGFGTDAHNAHTQPNGKYHYHANPIAMFNQTCDNAVESPVIGFAADGFPIFGSCIKDQSTGAIRQAQSSYALKNNGGVRQDVTGYLTPTAGVGGIASDNYDGQFRSDWEFVDGSGDLDQCNGMIVDGKYGYYVTDTFPWVINCFKGQINTTFGRAIELERRSHSHEDGEVHSH